MLNHQFGHDKSVPEAARNVRPFCKSCHMSLARGAPTCLLCTVPVRCGVLPAPTSTHHVRRRLPGKRLGKNSAGIRTKGYQVLSLSATVLCSVPSGHFLLNPHNNPMSSGVPLSPTGAEGQVCAQGWGGRQGWTQAAGLQVHLPVPHKGYKVLGALKKG